MSEPGAEGTGSLFRVGTAIRDITPPLSVPYLSFSPRHRPFSGIHDRLFLRAVVIGAGADTDVALISAETIGFADSLFGPGRSFIDEVRIRISQISGIDASRVMLTATHSHSTPDTINFRPLRESPGAMQWLESLIDQAAECVLEASTSRFDAQLRVVSGPLKGVAENRRGENHIANTMTLLSFTSPDPKQAIFLVHWACHPVIVQNQPLISGDFASEFIRLLESTPMCQRALFLQGACGDVNPVFGDKGNFEMVDSAATLIASKCAQLSADIFLQQVPVQPAICECRSEKLMLPSRELPPVGTDDEEELVHRRMEGTNPFQAEVQVIRLGDVTLVGVSGELFSEFDSELRLRTAPLCALLVGFSNGYIGYIVPPESWARGGYEASPGMWSKVGPESHELLLATATRLCLQEV